MKLRGALCNYLKLNGNNVSGTLCGHLVVCRATTHGIATVPGNISFFAHGNEIAIERENIDCR